MELNIKNFARIKEASIKLEGITAEVVKAIPAPRITPSATGFSLNGDFSVCAKSSAESS